MKSLFYLHTYVRNVEDSTTVQSGYRDLVIIQGQHRLHQKISMNDLMAQLFEINKFIGTLEYKNSRKPRMSPAM